MRTEWTKFAVVLGGLAFAWSSSALAQGQPCDDDDDCGEHQACYVEAEHCVFAYMLPCGTAADCGEGFTCEGEVCHIIEVDCDAASDCPEDWTCPGKPSEIRRCNPPAVIGYGGSEAGDTDGGVDEGSGGSGAGPDEPSGGCSLVQLPAVGGAGTLGLLLLGAGAGALRWRRKTSPVPRTEGNPSG